MSSAASNNIKELLATGAIDFSGDTFKIILMQAGFSFDPATHDEYADLSASELATAFGYTAGGNTLSGVTLTRNDTSDYLTITWTATTWTANGGSIGPSPGAIIYDDTATDDPIVGYIDFGANYTQEDGGVMTLNALEVRIS